MTEEKTFSSEVGGSVAIFTRYVIVFLVVATIGVVVIHAFGDKLSSIGHI